MQVLLRDEIPTLGDAGDIVTVKDGYARNFLLPRKLAVIADLKSMRMVEHEKRLATAKQSREKVGAEALGKRLQEVTLTFHRESGEEGKLFGSVTTQDIGKALQAIELTIDRRRIRLQEPIKQAGEYHVEIRLHPEVQVQVAVKVEGSAPEADKA